MMKLSSGLWNHHGPETELLDSSVTFENFRFIKPKPKSTNEYSKKYTKLHRNLNLGRTESVTMIPSVLPKKNLEADDLKFSDIESNFTSISQVQGENSNKHFNFKNTFRSSELTDNSKSFFSNVQETKYQSYNGDDSALSVTTKELNSDESFLTMMTRTKQKFEFINPKEDFQDFSKVLRLFNKHGKPLTDRMGRPLVDVLGQPLVVLDKQGRLLSDAKGNQVFNSHGESAIYSSTNLFIPPVEEEPGIPLLDIDKKHILFLYDSKGHPLTDGLGRPLVRATGSLMIGIKPKENININLYRNNRLKSLYGKAPLENFVRRVQIFDSDCRLLTDVNGTILRGARIICNKNGMPLCDENGRSLYFKYGARIMTPESQNLDKEPQKLEETIQKSPTVRELVKKTTICEEEVKSKPNNTDDLEKTDILNMGCSGDNGQINTELNLHSHSEEFKNKLITNNNYSTEITQLSPGFNNIRVEHIDMNSPPHLKHSNCNKGETNNSLNVSKNVQPQEDTGGNSPTVTTDNSPKKILHKSFLGMSSKKEEKDLSTNEKVNSQEAIIIFDASKNMQHQRKSSMNTTALKSIKGKQISHSIAKRKINKKMYTSNFIQYFKNALNLKSVNQNNNRSIYNDYGKPVKDFYGNMIYDKFGIPLTGGQGRKLSEGARHNLRMKLRNIPLLPLNKEQKTQGETMAHALTCNESHDQFGNPFYDKYGRPLYDLYGNLIYDTYGRPLTDAYGRPLIDGIGQPLMDAHGNVLTAGIVTSPSSRPTDLFGRYLFDKHGRPLFDSYGRPRFDIYTNAIYDNCGRPATDGNGNVLYDFLNKPIQPHPEKPLYKNARILLPRYIDRLLVMPSLRRVLKYSRTSLKDVFGGPLFDDFGRPLYNKLGKPLYDKYGRPLYDKDGKPLCDCYGRPVSEEIRRSPDDQTLSVTDSLKLLKLTKESNKWMEVKRSQTKNLKSTDLGVLDKAFIMKVVQPAKRKSTKYTYALTRVTTFSCGRQALEILEAPLSPSTAHDMHHLPVDNKPLIMMAKRRQKVTKKFWSTKPKPH